LAKGKRLKDIARLAEVSTSTVSRVASGNSTVSVEIQTRVRRAALQLGIGLDRKDRAKVLCFLLANRNVLHPFQARILWGAGSYCTTEGWEMLFLSFYYLPEIPPKELHLPQIFSRRDNVRGCILGGTNHPNLLAP